MTPGCASRSRRAVGGGRGRLFLVNYPAITMARLLVHLLRRVVAAAGEGSLVTSPDTAMARPAVRPLRRVVATVGGGSLVTSPTIAMTKSACSFRRTVGKGGGLGGCNHEAGLMVPAIDYASFSYSQVSVYGDWGWGRDSKIRHRLCCQHVGLFGYLRRNILSRPPGASCHW